MRTFAMPSRRVVSLAGTLLVTGALASASAAHAASGLSAVGTAAQVQYPVAPSAGAGSAGAVSPVTTSGSSTAVTPSSTLARPPASTPASGRPAAGAPSGETRAQRVAETVAPSAAQELQS